MKRIISIIIAALIVLGAYAAWQNKSCIGSMLFRIRNISGKATFHRKSNEVLPGGSIKTTFQSTDKIGADIEIAIISDNPMVLDSVSQKGGKTSATFRSLKK